jgi:hypothetical protein
MRRSKDALQANRQRNGAAKLCGELLQTFCGTLDLEALQHALDAFP